MSGKFPTGQADRMLGIADRNSLSVWARIAGASFIRDRD
ncbi:hypothetical protein EMEDMD4_1180007 [Sinorhizobium medicae]|uniref:Uncharacterized protein n=1 Tax=Sinorhizobium medicae TaxID=110321 RepID=A0A508WUG6_9HYPH|nr:hypothetical protein EMEDMD4_1180007 [Sinorhizobium medicae]